MPHHAILVRIGDLPAFQSIHSFEGLLHGPCHPLEKAVLEPHPADVQG